MKNILLFLFLVLHFNTSFSQNIDSLERLLSSNIPDSSQLKIYLDLSNNRKVAFQTALDHANKGLILARDRQNTLMEGKFLRALGRRHLLENKLEQAIEYYDSVIKLSETLDTKEGEILLAQSKANLGITYKRLGRLDEALKAQYEALEIYKKHKYQRLEAGSYSNIGSVLLVQKNYEMALEQYFKALEIADVLEDKKFKASVNNNIGAVYTKRGEEEKAIEYLEKALSSIRELGNKYQTVVALNNLSTIYQNIVSYDKAEAYLLEALGLSLQLNYDYGLGFCNSNLTTLSYRKEEYQTAIQYGLAGIPYIEENLELKHNTWFYLYKSYEALGNINQAFKYQSEYIALNDSLLGIEKQRAVQELEVQYEVKEKEIENELLKAKEEVAQKNIRNSIITALGLLLGLILSLGWGYSVYQSNIAKKKMNQVLEEKVTQRTAELQQSNKNLEQANYELKTFNYIASHDIKEPIRNIGSFVGLIERKLSKEVKKELFFYFATIKRSTKQLYTLIEDFSNYTTLSKKNDIELEEVDLNSIFQGLEDTFYEVIHERNCKFINHGLPTIKTSPSLLFISIKHIVDNAFKYNNAEIPTVEIAYKEIDNTHHISVIDNGIGINEAYFDQIFTMFKRLHDRAAYQGSGIGLAISKLMIGKLDGSIQVESKEGDGSKFTILLPLKA